jgi:hypothetical protein
MGDSVKSKALTRFIQDIKSYSKETGKDAKQALSNKALDVAIKVKLRAKKAAPDTVPDGSAFEGYNVRVRTRAGKGLGIKDSKGFDYRGRISRKVKGKTITNKRAIAVARELAIRRSSVKFIQKIIPTWSRSKAQVPEGITTKLFGEAYTRRRKSKVGEAEGKFKDHEARIKIESEPKKGKTSPGLRAVLESIQVKGINDSREDTRRYIAKRQGRTIAKNLKRSYKAS